MVLEKALENPLDCTEIQPELNLCAERLGNVFTCGKRIRVRQAEHSPQTEGFRGCQRTQRVAKCTEKANPWKRERLVVVRARQVTASGHGISLDSGDG